MKTIWSATLLLAIGGAVANAQPGQTPPIEPYPPPPTSPYPEPPPQAYPPQQPYVPAPHQYQPPMQVQLTADEQELLQQGEISEGAHIGGGLLSLVMGFGLGQAVQGRWDETGWIFTLGEAASIAAIMVGASKSFDDCFVGDERCNDSEGETYLVAGVVGFLVFRTWEIVDAFGGPGKHNRRVRDLRMRLGGPQPMYTRQLTPYLNKTRDGGGTAGVSFRF